MGGRLLNLAAGEVAVAEALEVGEGGRPAVGVHVGDGGVAQHVLAALARVGLAAEAVHADGQRLVRLARQRPERHAAGAEAAHNVLERLHLVEGDGLPVRLDVEQVAQRRQRRGAQRLLEELVAVHVLGLQRLVQQLGERRAVVVVLLARVVLDEAVVLQVLERRLREPGPVQRVHLVGQLLHRQPAHARHRAAEAEVDELPADPDGLEDLRRVVGREQRDADLAHDLEQTRVHRLAVVVQRVADADARDLALLHERLGLGRVVPRPHRLQRRVGVHRRRPEAEEAREVVRAPALRRLRDERRAEPQLLAEQVVVHRPHGQQRRNVRLLRRDAALGQVRQHKDLRARAHRRLRLLAQRLHGLAQAGGARRHLVEGGKRLAGAAAVLYRLDLAVVEQRALQLDQARLRLRRPLHRVALGAQVHLERHDNRLPQRVDGRVRHLPHPASPAVTTRPSKRHAPSLIRQDAAARAGDIQSKSDEV